MKYSYHLEIFQEPLANSKDKPELISGIHSLGGVAQNELNMYKAIKKELNSTLKEKIDHLTATEEAPGH